MDTHLTRVESQEYVTFDSMVKKTQTYKPAVDQNITQLQFDLLFFKRFTTRATSCS